jgi:hypothetical protein
MDINDFDQSFFIFLWFPDELSQDAYLLVFVFVEVEAIFFPFLDLGKIVVEGFLRNIDRFGSFLQRYFVF